MSIHKIFYVLTVVSLIFPGGIALVNFLKEGFSSYWIPFLIPSVLFLAIGIFLSHKKRS